MTLEFFQQPQLAKDFIHLQFQLSPQSSISVFSPLSTVSILMILLRLITRLIEEKVGRGEHSALLSSI